MKLRITCFASTLLLQALSLANASELSLDTPIEKVLPDSYVTFETNESVLTEKEAHPITHHADYLNNNPNLRVVVAGHADERGSVEFNHKLADSRADHVAKALTDMGVESDRITKVIYGEHKPLESQVNNKNRRVTIIYQRPTSTGAQRIQ